MSRRFVGFCLVIASVLAFPCGPRAAAHEQPTPEDVATWKKAEGIDGYDERVERVKRLQLEKIAPGLGERATYELRKASLQAAGLTPQQISWELFGGRAMAFPYSAAPELKSIGSPRTLTLLVDFKDYRAANVLPGLTADRIRQNIYGPGVSQAASDAPFESVNAYYKRASEGKVDLQGAVLGWHSFAKNRGEYQPASAGAVSENRALFKLATEALQALDAAHDFAQYDNDNDGDIDLLTIMYAGPNSGWGSFWWAYRWEFFVPEASQVTLDGKRLKQFVFQFVDTRNGGADFNPRTLVHEMGHAFGLPDYYDYDPNPQVGPPGGVGGLDIMDANQGNHNAFSRWLLDWIQPQIVGSGAPQVKNLTASGTPGAQNKAVAIFPNLANSAAPGGEMFIVENRARVGNDAKMPGNGLLIWHVDATPNAANNGFAYDNSYTDRKLIRLMRADNPNDFNHGEHATAADYFVAGREFTPTSVPPSNDHAGNPTQVAVSDIVLGNPAATARIGFLPGVAPAAAVAASNVAEGVVPAGYDESGPGAPGGVGFAGPAESEYVDVGAVEKFSAKISELTADELAAAWQDYQARLKPGALSRQQQVEVQLLLARWGRADGQAAVEAALKLSDFELLQEAYPRVLEAWAANQPALAAAWYLDAKSESIRTEDNLAAGEAFAQAIYKWQALNQPQEAIKSLDKLDRMPELWGAIEGIEQARELTGFDKKLLQSMAGELEKEAAIREIVKCRNALLNLQDPSANSPAQQEIRAIFFQKLEQSGAIHDLQPAETGD
ncbi:MAG: M6 family metalloprotease domain-containing protein [Pirellulales bacterium]|nr:M6 family metalloprotease domain-containing protein [Pirellulales bacterium]